MVDTIEREQPRGSGGGRCPYCNAPKVAKVFEQPVNMLFSGGADRHELLCGLVYAAVNVEMTECSSRGDQVHMDTIRHRIHQDLDHIVDHIVDKMTFGGK